MDKAVTAAQDIQSARRDFQIIHLGTVLLQHLQIAVLRGHAAGAPAVVMVCHYGEQRPHKAVLCRAAGFVYRLHRQGDVQGLTVCQFIQTLVDLSLHKFPCVFHFQLAGLWIVHYRQAADHSACHTTLRSPCSSCTPMMRPSSARSSLSTVRAWYRPYPTTTSGSPGCLPGFLIGSIST